MGMKLTSLICVAALLVPGARAQPLSGLDSCVAQEPHEMVWNADVPLGDVPLDFGTLCEDDLFVPASWALTTFTRSVSSALRYSMLPTTMADLDAAKPDTGFCDIPNNHYEAIGGLYCEQWDELSRNFAGEPSLYDRLVAQSAPIIAVPYSPDGIDYMTFDAGSGSFYPLFYSGR